MVEYHLTLRNNFHLVFGRMGSTFHQTPFSRHFNFLTYLGFWPIETANPIFRKLFNLYSVFNTIIIGIFIYGGVVDLYYYLDNFRKVSYNLCINTMVVAVWFKTIQAFIQSDRINDLRRRLHREESLVEDEEGLQICRSTTKELFFIERVFYLNVILFFPAWLALSLFSDSFGTRHLPLPSKWFVEVDLYDPFVFYPLFFLHATFSTFYLIQVVSTEVSAYSLLLQIIREYKFLEKKVNSLVTFCEDPECKEKGTSEFNSVLKSVTVKKMLREIIIRQVELMRCTEDYEYIYNLSMLIHIFIGGFLLVMNGVETLIVSLDVDLKMSYQIGYICTIVIDFLYHCLLATRISSKCKDIGVATYTAPWINMNKDLRGDILLIILRSQKPPKLTSGRMIELNLHTFMVLMRNICSWLAVFRQIGFN